MNMPTVAGLLAISLVCHACSYGQKGVDSRSLSLKRHPGQAIQVTGTVPNGFTVAQLRLQYSTNSTLPFCNGQNFPGGGPFPLSANLYLPTTKSGDGISAEVQPDRYAPGLCRWQLAAIYAVLKNAEGEENQPLVAIDYNWYKVHNLLGDHDQTEQTSTFYCGHKHVDFGCSDGGTGDSGYFPVEIKGGTRQVQFVIRDSGYRAPSKSHPK